MQRDFLLRETDTINICHATARPLRQIIKLDVLSMHSSYEIDTGKAVLRPHKLHARLTTSRGHIANPSVGTNVDANRN